MLAAIGPGPVQGDEGGHVVEAGRGERAHEGPHGAALELEHADGVAPPQHPETAGSSRATSSMSGRCPGGALDQVEGPLDDREVAQPEEVHLEQAELLDAVHLVLGDDRGVLGVDARRSGLRWIGQVLGERVLGDDHGGGVDAVLAPQALEALGHVDDLAGPRGRTSYISRSSVGRLVAVLVALRSCSRQARSGVSRPMTSGGMALAMRSPTL